MASGDAKSIIIWPDGTVVVPDLADGLHTLADVTPLPWQLGRHARVDLAQRAAQARELLGPTCRLCARGCAVDRRHGQRGFTRAHHYAQIAHPRLNDVRCNLHGANRLQFTIHRLHQQQFQAFGSGVFQRANRRARYASQ